MENADYIEKFANQLDWSSNEAITPGTITQYLQGLDMVDEFRGHPNQLGKALTFLQAIDSKPLALAGVAYVLTAASYIQSRKYSAYGLGLAQKWLNLAYVIEPENAYIKIIQLYIDMNKSDDHPSGWKPDDLESVSAQIPDNIHVQYIWLDFKCRCKGEKESLAHYESMLKLATTESQEAKAHQRMMSHYFFAIRAMLAMGSKLGTSYFQSIDPYLKQSEKIFSRMKRFSEDDPWFWHNQSILYLMSLKYWKAAKLNKKALSLMTFEAALNVQAEVKKKLGFLYYFT